MVYTNKPVSVESSIQTMEQFLAEDKYQVVGFDLEYTIGRAGHNQKVAVGGGGCYRVPPGALPSSLHARCPCLGPMHDHARSCACGCAGRGATMQLPAAKTAMRTR